MNAGRVAALGLGRAVPRAPANCSCGSRASSACTRSRRSNALHYAYQTHRRRRTRKLLLLQAAAFLPLFREAMKSRGKVGDAADRRARSRPNEDENPSVEEVFATLSKDRLAAARLAMSVLKQQPGGGARS